MALKEAQAQGSPRIHEPRYVRFDRGLAIDFGAPEDLYGPEELNRFVVDTRIYIFHPESVIGTMSYPGTGERLPLTSPTYNRAIRLQEFSEVENLPTGRVIYLLLSQVPLGMFGWSETPIEVIEPDWVNTVSFLDGSLADVLNDPSNRVIAVDIEHVWKEHGADTKSRDEKQIHHIKRYNIP